MTDTIIIRRATPDDIPVLAVHRRLMFQDMGYTDPDQLGAMEASFCDWVRERLISETYMHWLAVDGDHEIAAGAGVWIREQPPKPFDRSGRQAYAMNVYTMPAYRRRGLARRLMHTLLDWCRAQGFGSVVLHYTADSRALYESLGFTDDNVMVKRS